MSSLALTSDMTEFESMFKRHSLSLFIENRMMYSMTILDQNVEIVESKIRSVSPSDLI